MNCRLIAIDNSNPDIMKNRRNYFLAAYTSEAKKSID